MCNVCGASPVAAWFEGPNFRKAVDSADKVHADWRMPSGVRAPNESRRLAARLSGDIPERWPQMTVLSHRAQKEEAPRLEVCRLWEGFCLQHL
jgi:hypothetical protein